MVNPSLIFTISILIVITILFLVATFTGWLGTNPYVLPMLLILTAWGFALWLGIGYYAEWTPYKSTKSNSANNIQSNKNYNKTLFIYSAIFFIATTILFIVFLMLVIVYKTPKQIYYSRPRQVIIRKPIYIPPQMPLQSSEAETDIPTETIAPLSEAELPSKMMAPTSEAEIPSKLRTGTSVTQPSFSELQMDRIDKLERLVEKLRLEQSLQESGAKVNPGLEADIKQKQEELSAYEISGVMTPEEEALATRIAEYKIKRGQESLTKYSPSSYFTRRKMFGPEGESTRIN